MFICISRGKDKTAQDPRGDILYDIKREHCVFFASAMAFQEINMGMGLSFASDPNCESQILLQRNPIFLAAFYYIDEKAAKTLKL
jgi:hypothetical protein